MGVGGQQRIAKEAETRSWLLVATGFPKAADITWDYANYRRITFGITKKSVGLHSGLQKKTVGLHLGL